MSAPTAQRGVLRTLLTRPAALVSIVWLLVVSIACFGAPVLAPHSPTAQSLLETLKPPSAQYLLGTDSLGRDVLSRLMYGGAPALVQVAEAVAVFLIVGVTLGMVAGYFGGVVDQVISRIVDLVFSIPGIIMVLVVLAVFPANENAAMITYGALGGTGLARILRSRAAAVRGLPFIDAARVSGLADGRILVRHIFNRVLPTVIVQASIYAGVALLLQTGLAFLGLGAPEPAPSWGGAVADASTAILRSPWLLIPTGGVIILTAIAFGMLGNALRDAVTSRYAPSSVAPARVRAARASSVPAEEDADRARGGEDAILRVRGLTIDVPGPSGERLPIVQDVSFEVLRGGVLGIVGESGSGKTMTILGVLGLLPGGGAVSSGSIWFDGIDLTGSGRAQYDSIRGTRVAFIAQDPMNALDPTHSVGAHLREALARHRGMKGARATAEAVSLLEAVNIPDPRAVLKRYPHQLSGGMAQRVCIAMALAGEPDLLIADEPTTALDVTVQAEILDVLRDIAARRSMSIILVTHDWGVVADLCTDVVVMYAGQIVESAPLEPVFAEPRHPYTEALLASIPTAGDGVLPSIPGSIPRPGEWPAGCRFADRCRLVRDDCRAAPVPLLAPQPDHVTRCLHHDELAAAEPEKAML